MNNNGFFFNKKNSCSFGCFFKFSNKSAFKYNLLKNNPLKNNPLKYNPLKYNSLKNNSLKYNPLKYNLMENQSKGKAQGL